MTEHFEQKERGAPNEISRSAVLYEVWVKGEDPKAYLLLVHKISKNWWELPGGEIEGDPTRDRRVMVEALRELDEEIQIDKRPEVSTFSASALSKNPLGNGNDITIELGDRRIVSHPFMVREVYEKLPDVRSGRTEEHDDYRWLDVTNLYSTSSSQTAHDAHAILFENIIATGSNGGLPDVPVSMDTTNPKIITVGQSYPSKNQKVENLSFSAVTARILKSYTDNTINVLQPPSGFQRPK